MKYESMTIAQLRHEAKERGVEVPRNPKKGDLVDALTAADRAEDGAVSVEAELIEDSGEGLAVKMVPGVLDANFDALEANVDRILADYEGWEPSADSSDDVEQCARTRKYLNGLAGEIDERRKAVKREYTKPLAEFEARANHARDRIKEVSARLQAVEKKADEARRLKKRLELVDEYREIAPVLFPVVPYDRIADPKWLNKQPGVEACKRELAERVARVAADLEVLRGLDLPFADQAEMRFFDTLDLGQATAWSAKLVADKEKLDRLKEEQAAMRAEPAPGPVPVAAVKAVPEPMPMIVSDAVPEPMPLIEPKANPEPMPMIPAPSQEPIIVPDPSEERRPWVVVIPEATRGDMQGLAKLLKMSDVSGSIHAGTLDQVYRKVYGGR